MKILHLFVAAIRVKIFTELFHYQQENFTGISGKGEERKKEWREKCVLVLKVWQGNKETWKSDKFLILYVPCCKQTQKREAWVF